MSLQSFIERVTKQTAVYWKFDGADGFGGVGYAPPEEISCRWDDDKEVVTTSNGVEFVSMAQLLVTRDYEERGMIKYGDLSGIDINEDPTQIDGTYEIEVIERHPEFASDTFDIFLIYL
jgi:hypothetical protein